MTVKVQPIEGHEQSEVRMEGAAGVKMRMLIGPGDGAKNFHMRHFEIDVGGNTPFHQHDFEHEVLILTGSGVVRSEEGDRSFNAGDVIFVSSDEKHQFVNTGNSSCSFICLIPAPRDCCT
ncbi:MAG: cupin domain-containing protein [Phycisphaerales bacterium]|nr:MAG: cupin domain-containing protein [Phycisphaerales bacterium]